MAEQQAVIDRGEQQVEHHLDIEVGAELAVADRLPDQVGGHGAAGAKPLVADAQSQDEIAMALRDL
jgi:hypothetical protein